MNQEQDLYKRSIVQKFIDWKCSMDKLNSIREMYLELFEKILDSMKLEKMKMEDAPISTGGMCRKIEKDLDFKPNLHVFSKSEKNHWTAGSHL